MFPSNNSLDVEKFTLVRLNISGDACMFKISCMSKVCNLQCTYVRICRGEIGNTLSLGFEI